MIRELFPATMLACGILIDTHDATSGAHTMTSAPLAVHDYRPGGLDPAMEFLKRTRSELRLLRMVRVGKDFLRIFDVNGDSFEIRDLGYADADLIPLLQSINAVYNPNTIHEHTAAEYKEFKTGRCRPWAEDRVM
jgi:hypothetical protein